MSENKFTAGPWILNTARMGDEILLGWHIAAGEHGSSLPICLSDKYSEFRIKEQELANARLIAAAPELLDALEKAVSEDEQAEFERWLSREAPSGDCEAVQRQWEESANFRDFHNWWGGAIAAISKARGES